MKQRVISAAVAIALVIPFVYFGGIIYALGIGVVALLGYKEVIDLKKSHHILPVIPSIIAILALLLIVYTDFHGTNFMYGSTYMHLIFLSLALLIPTVFYKDDKYTTSDAFYLIGTIIFLGIAFNSFILVRDAGIGKFLYLVSIPICTDTAAYFVGCAIGKHKMCPKISPKKSWEGAIAGLVIGTILPSTIYMLLIKDISIVIFVMSAILSTIGQIGDLIFSKIKRENDIKDFSNLMPGHGGCLDRLDSSIVIFMAYIFLSYILL